MNQSHHIDDLLCKYKIDIWKEDDNLYSTLESITMCHFECMKVRGKTQFNLLCFCMFGFFVPVTHMETSNPLSVVFDYICYVLKSTFVYLIKKGNKKLLQQVQIQNLLFLFENGHYHLGRGRGCSIENGCNSTNIWKWKTVMINNEYVVYIQ